MGIRYPNINASTEAEHQIRAYLFQLVEELNYILGDNGGAASASTAEIETLVGRSTRVISELAARLGGKFVPRADLERFIGEALVNIGKKVAWKSLGLSEGVTDSSVLLGRADGAGCFYRESADGTRISVAFNCAFPYTGSAVRINAEPLPEGYRPRGNVYAVCAADGALAHVLLGSDGFLSVESLITTSADATAPAEVSWIDGYIDYFKEDEYVY